MDRREFLALQRNKQRASKVAVNTTMQHRNVTSGIGLYTGSWTKNEAIHLLKRTMFGAKAGDVDYFLTKTLSQCVDELLDTTAPFPSPPLKEYATTTTLGATPDTAVVQGTTWVNDVNNDGTVQSQRRASLKKWWTGNLINQSRNIREKMVVFFMDHFGNEQSDVGNANLAYIQMRTIYQNYLGNLKQFTRDMSIDPHMLRYLNGYLNTATAPDENYGRELQELFCCGKGPGSNYTENDVKEAAKTLTGWQVNYSTYTSFFTSSRHSTVNKTFSAFYNNTVITGRTGVTAGMLELDDLINMIFNTQETAKFFVRKLYRFFVYYQIDATVEANVIDPLATIFRNSNYNIKTVLTTLLKSEHFFDVLNQACYIKTPADLVIGSLRELNVTFPPLTDWDTNYGIWNSFYAYMANTQQNLGEPPNVAGMPAFYQEPSYHELWITTDTLPKRNQYTDLMIASGLLRNSIRVQFNLPVYIQTLYNPGNPNDLIDGILKNCFSISISNESKKQIKTQILLSGQQYDYYWTNAWHAYLANPANTTNFNTVNNRLKSLFQYLMALSEYQLM
jgi:uncharacterized protein (DUF1800 family)